MTSYCYNVYDSPFSIPTMFPMWSILNSYWATKGVSTYRCTIQLLLYSQSKQSWRYILFSFWSEVVSSLLSLVLFIGWCEALMQLSQLPNVKLCPCRDQQFSNTPKASIVWHSEELACLILHLQAIDIHKHEMSQKQQIYHIYTRSLTIARRLICFLLPYEFLKVIQGSSICISISRGRQHEFFQRCISIATAFLSTWEKKVSFGRSNQPHAHASLSRPINQFLACSSTTT
jgi:hypothetical protein